MTARVRYPLGMPLSAREVEVVSLVAEGLTNVEIAGRLVVSSLTVKSHLANVADKLGTGDRAGIVGAAYRTRQLTVVCVGNTELDERYTAVLVGIARGWSNEQMAAEQFTNVHTVKSRVKALFRLLGVHDRAAAVRAGLECGALTLVPRARTVVDARDLHAAAGTAS